MAAFASAFLLLPMLMLLPNPSSSITLPLLPVSSPPPLDNPYRSLSTLASSSLLRARHLRRPSPDFSSSLSATTLPLSPHSYGGSSIPLSLGTPPQPLPLLLDTGSHLVWVPCTASYSCLNCSSSSSPPPRFLPKSSSTARLVGCRNPKCSWIHTPSAAAAASAQCSSDVCPVYLLLYASGSTSGALLSDTLRIVSGNLTAPGFAFGCSVFSSHQPPAGVAGFGRGPASLPSQLHLRRFSYCLASRRYDDVPGKVGSVVLDDDLTSGNMRSTPFAKNPAAAGSPFDVYYYVHLRRIAVDGKKARVPRRLLVPGADGNGGTIVDSGSTFTFMEREVFGAVATAVEEAVAGRYNRSSEAEARTGLRLCFRVEGEEVRLPELELHFKGGAVMELPLENYFAVVGDTGDVCFMVVTGEDDGGTGPAVILGGFQQQDYRMLFDLERGRLGFRRESCLQS